MAAREPFDHHSASEPESVNRRSGDTAPEHAGRRSGDRAESGAGAPPSATGAAAGGRGRNAFRRFRRPLIGLGLAGMALPMVRATSAEQAAADEPDDAQDTGMPETATVGSGADAEDQLAERVAASRADQAREQQVTTAVEQHSISRDLAEDIYDAAREANIEPRLAYGLVKTESMFDERAVSPVGARGLTQVMPRTAAWLVPGTRTQDLYDRQTNLRLGFTYLDQMITKYKGDVRLALLAYNRGPGTVDRVLKRGGNPDNGYADKVLRG
jgi:soluble lytic murein transglycosylase-like protein